MSAIMERASKMPCKAIIVTANGFFKAIMRRSVGKEGEWFWALEWNKNLRLVGAIGKPDSVPIIFRDLPQLEWNELKGQDDIKTIMRREIPLDDEQDQLFSGNVEMAESA